MDKKQSRAGALDAVGNRRAVHVNSTGSGLRVRETHWCNCGRSEGRNCENFAKVNQYNLLGSSIVGL